MRKVGGLCSVSASNREAVEAAVTDIATATTQLLEQLPDRKVPPKTIPRLRCPEVRARVHVHD